MDTGRKCPINSRDCAGFADCSFCKNASRNPYSCCALLDYIKKYNHEKSFEARLNELIDDVGGYEE